MPSPAANLILLGGSGAGGAKLTDLARAVVSAENHGLLTAQFTYGMIRSISLWLFQAAPVGCLTTLHPIFIQSIRRGADSPSAYEEVLNFNLTKVDRSITPLRPLDVIEYFFAAGDACHQLASGSPARISALLERSKQMFEQCLTAPVHRVPHDLQIRAAARWTLLVLGTTDEPRVGGNISLPAHTSIAVQRAWKRHSGPYAGLEDLFTSRRRSAAAVNELRTYVVNNAQVWERDGTQGLVRWLVEARHPIVRVSRLGETFTRLKVKDVVQMLEIGARESETQEALAKRVREMIEHWIGEFQLKGAKLDPPSVAGNGEAAMDGQAILSFNVAPVGESDYYSSLSFLDNLQRQMEDLQRCNAHIEYKERNLARSKGFVAKMQSGAALGRGGNGPGGGMMGMTGMGMGGGMGRFDDDEGEGEYRSGGMVGRKDDADIRSST
ncbi:hypothetical protein BDZ90DRAFT_160572 [Jaminaea rosea]|uniref:Uncharacterized protein n=1 Tax=Jaminaea rosea TaxID=1569628 RepID=A0A316USS3_9BASI|nr:hypothetical protein BDZ90DRAFT_160572 [Jaminaea rosea]PWN28044.1 hypothetical protein BDZ90DRAFT_160572 [Jaminaea rosea]